MNGRTTTRTQDAANQRDAAHALLLTPIVTAARAPETLTLIRQHATALKSMFASQLGYQLTVETTFARLVKGPLEPMSPVRPLKRRGDADFGASHYAVFASPARHCSRRAPVSRSWSPVSSPRFVRTRPSTESR